MLIDKFSENGGADIDASIRKGEPMLAVIAFDGSHAIIGLLDECMEHHILLTKSGLSSADIDNYFRIVFDRSGANWTFACPPGYMNIPDKAARISRFYTDGFATISAFMAEMGLLVGLKIPKRYKRHLDLMTEA
ncbi:MAG: hypothetical protein LBH93_06755 [Chitinispirillales bacterium]|jgi:hypothetical protein|nr:hypothetical protein [Chitinispirillales bacterium]